MSSSAGGVISMVTFFWMTVSLPLKKLHKERSRALTRNTAGPSLIPVSFDETIVTFVCMTGGSYSCEKRECSVPPAESVTATDFRPVPCFIDFYFDGSEPKGVGVRCDFDLRFVPFKLGH